MTRISCTLLLFVLFFCHDLRAQHLEKVIVETYYIADANDATDTDGGKLEQGSVTYRVYIDLAEGVKLKKIYGDVNHALKIASTAHFFNNQDRGASFGKDINGSVSSLRKNTVALDTWLTIGQATTNHAGVLKDKDTDGSKVGGKNNNGGSAKIPEGLLANADPTLGIPLTTADGLLPKDSLAAIWSEGGFSDATGEDSTIFGQLKEGTQFISNDAYLLQSLGVKGPTPENIVLVAQLTTKGEIAFELNVELVDQNGNTLKYVAREPLVADELLSSELKYPPVCGCRDPQYLEYNPKFGCDLPGACKTLIVFGCTEVNACNYDPKANFNIHELCCYPDSCGGRDIKEVCPHVGIDEPSPLEAFQLFPNPAQDQLTLEIPAYTGKEAKYIIYDAFGKAWTEKSLRASAASLKEQVDITELPAGLYMFQLFIGEASLTRKFIKR